MTVLDDIFETGGRARSAAEVEGWTRLAWDRYECDGRVFQLVHNPAGPGWVWSEVRDEDEIAEPVAPPVHSEASRSRGPRSTRGSA